MNKLKTDNKLYCAREDLIPFSFGGNKARKAMLFFEEILNTSANAIVTYGSNSSNHCRVVSNIAASNNILCVIISPEDTLKKTANLQLMKLFGAKIIVSSIEDVKSKIDDQMNQLANRGYKPYFIPGGGHGTLGTMAYVEAFNEIIAYEKVNKVSFDYIFHASGTGTTQAGLVCGNIVNNTNKKIVGISIARKNPHGGQVVLESMNDYLQSIGIPDIERKVVEFIDDYICDGYGSYNNQIINTIKDVMIHEGIPLDPTYTGKAFWGMTDYLQRNKITNKNVLFIHTGGTPLFFDSIDILNT